MPWVDNQTLTVELGFGSGPLVASPSWTDVTSAVRRIQLKRGRTSTRRDFAPGMAVVVFDNSDAEFDPNNSSATHYGDLNIGTPIRITGTYDMNGYVFFYGAVTKWPLLYNLPSDSVAQLECTDRMNIIRTTYLDDVSYSAQASWDTIGDILDDVGWPAGQRSAPDQSLSVGAIDNYTGSAGVLIDRVMEAEQGFFFIDRAGQATMDDRIAFSGISSADFDFGTGGDFSYHIDPVVTWDDDYLVNVAVVTGADEVATSYTNSSSVTAYGERKYETTNTVVVDTGAALNVATWIAERYGTPQPRIRFRVDPDTDPTNLWDEINNVDLGYVRGLVFQPPGGGDAINDVFKVERLEMEIEAGRWIVTYEMYPLVTFETQSYWILGTSDDLDTNTILA